jgi:hypothetical protein
MVKNWKVHIKFHSKLTIVIQYVVWHKIIGFSMQIFPQKRTKILMTNFWMAKLETYLHILNIVVFSSIFIFLKMCIYLESLLQLL